MTIKRYSLTIKQFNRLLDVKNASKKEDEMALKFMNDRNKEYYSKTDANAAKKVFKNTFFFHYIDVEETY